MDQFSNIQEKWHKRKLIHSIYWSYENPHRMIKEECNVQRVKVWVGTWAMVLVPLFIKTAEISTKHRKQTEQHHE